MFKSASVLSAAVLAVAGLASSASAATITPNPIGPAGLYLTGGLTIYQDGVFIHCNVKLRGYVPTGGREATITDGYFEPGDWQCGSFVSPTGFNWRITPNGGTWVTIEGIGITTILGNCSGNITTNWTNGLPGSITFSGLGFPGSPSACFITGTLFSSPSLTVS